MLVMPMQAGFTGRITTKADVLSLHIPWTPETNKMVDAAFIDAFAKPFWVFNTEENIVTADLAAAMNRQERFWGQDWMY
jgi:phosphoglycerate dehydrogenase-like enzyme